MTSDRIIKLLSLGEGQLVEFKSSTSSLDALGKVVCGFINTSGGYLIYGVNEKGDVIGIDKISDVIIKLERLFIEKISPKAFIAVQVEQLDSKPIVIIEVPSGKDVPYAFKDIIYIRSDHKTLKADAEFIRDIVMRHQIEPERWERRFSFADIEKDVDESEVLAAVEDAEKMKRAFFRDATKCNMVLEDFAAAKYGRMTNGGDVLFTTNPALRLPQTRIRAMRYNSDKSGNTFSDMKSFEGPLKQVFEAAYSFVVRNTPSISRFIKGSPKREDSPLYPEEAVREALINALAHRDYSSASGGVSIHVYPKRLEVWNSGPLPDGVTEESLLKGQISVLRNPDIAHALYLRGFMEKAGRGSVLMVQQCRDSGLPDPVWKSDAKLGVTVIFSSPEVTPEVTPEVEELVRHLIGKISRRDLMASMSMKDSEHFRKTYLIPGQNLGLIEMTILDKPKSSKQKYRLTEKGKLLAGKDARRKSK